MKKQAIETTTPEKREKLSDAKTKRTALHVMGIHFALTLVGKSKNPKIKDFREDGESCFLKVQKWNKSKMVMALWVMATAFLCVFFALRVHELGLLASLEDWVIPSSGIAGILTGFIACLYSSNNLSEYDRPGDTSKMVAKEWKPLRKRLVAANVVSNFGSDIQWSHRTVAVNSPILKEIEHWQFSGSALENALGNLLERMAQKCAGSFQKAELDGTKREQRRLRKQFGEIDYLGQALGYEKLNWEMLDLTKHRSLTIHVG